MHEIRLHGRGGQGTVLASTILARALILEGQHAVAIPSFGFERRGAPVAAFLRTDAREIRVMTNIYKPDCILVIDPTVGRAIDVFAGMKPGGTWVQCTDKPLKALSVPDTVAKVGLCNAVAIALKIFGKPITNSIMLGAFARTTGLVSLSSLQDSLESGEFRDAGLQQNLDGMAQGFASTTVHELSGRVPHVAAS